jgi:CelD/BcsL family acetyltransferase involved in cellulose biosynthesis
MERDFRVLEQRKSSEDNVPSSGRFGKRRRVRAQAIAAISRTPVLSVRTLKSADEIREHRALWNWPGTCNSELDSFLYFASVRTEVIRPQVFVAYRGATPEAMLLARLEQRQIPMRLAYWNFETLRLRVLNVVYGGLRGSTATDITETLVEQALETLRRGEADVAVFEPVGVNSPLWRTLETLPKRSERGFYGAKQNHYRLQLPPRSHDLREMISPKQRRNYLRKERKLVRDFSGDVSCQWYRQPSSAMYRDLQYVADRSFQQAIGVGFQDTPELRKWWELAAAKGWLRTCVLYARGKPCAFMTGMANSGILRGDYMAYDRQFAAYSPGMCLVLRGFGELCDSFEEHGIREIDFGPGDSDLKSLLSTSCEQEGSVYLYAPTLKGFGLNLMLSLTSLADESVRNSLSRGNLLSKAARRLRRERAMRSMASQSRETEDQQ